jgi:rhodanese-related sulfurtransferase
MSRLFEFIQHHPFLAGLLVLLVLALTVDEALRRMRKYRELAAAQAVLLINKGAAVLDLRSPAEFDAGHIINARNLPLTELDARAAELDKLKGQTVLLCSKDGSDAGAAAVKLIKRGLGPVDVLKGGMTAWAAEQFPLEKR